MLDHDAPPGKSCGVVLAVPLPTIALPQQ